MQIIYKVIAAGLYTLMNASSGSGDPSKVKPLAMLQGHDTLIEYPLVRMIKDSSVWSELWTLHKGIAGVATASGGIVNGDARTPPSVDFAKNQVLIVFGGQVPNVQAYDYVKTDVEDKTAVIHLAPSFFQNPNAQVMMTPYIMLVLPKEKVGIAVDLEVVAKDGTHSVNRIAHFNPPKDPPKTGG